MLKTVWHARARKFVEVELPQWHDRACKMGSVEIDDPKADPLNLDDPEPEYVTPLDVALERYEQRLSDAILESDDPDEIGWLEEALDGLHVFDVADPGVAQYLGMTGIPRRPEAA